MTQSCPEPHLPAEPVKARSTTLRRLALSMLALLAIAAFATPAAAQTTVARLQVLQPDHSPYTLRGTFPVPKGLFPRPDGLLPWAIQSTAGNTVPSQIEVVSRYANAADGADVVEIQARVNHPSGTSGGQKVTFNVVEFLHPPRRVRPPLSIATLHATPGQVVLGSADVFGHEYDLDLIHNTDGVKRMRQGRVSETYRFHGMMRPRSQNVGAPNGALKRFLGVHSYATVWDSEDVLSLDLRVHNGISGADKSDPLDNPQADIYFEALEVSVPAGWTVLQEFEDPCFGPEYVKNGSTARPIVEPLANGKMHVMPQQAQFHRRLAITQVGNEERARAILNGAGLGFCVDGYNGQGKRLWSWWNGSTARYYPTNIRLPHVDWIPDSNIGSYLNNNLNTIATHVKNGTSQNTYPLWSKALGWAHPWGVKYGGMTGGTEIYSVDGVLTADRASLTGYRYMKIRHRMYTERHPVALYNKNGNPSRIEDWVIQSSNSYIPMSFFLKLIPGTNDPFGFTSAPKYQVNFVQQNNLEPPYETDLREHLPIDQQHYIRYTNSPKVLVWLGNDPLAKDDLEMSAELMRLSYTLYPNNPSGSTVPSTMLQDRKHVDKWPGIGMPFGRGEGWSIDCATAAYAIGSDSFRARFRGWYHDILDLVEEGQADCTGHIQSLVSNALFSGQYRTRQAVEAAIIDIALLGMHEAVFEGLDTNRAQRTKQILENSAYGADIEAVLVAQPTRALDDLGDRPAGPLEPAVLHILPVRWHREWSGQVPRLVDARSRLSPHRRSALPNQGRRRARSEPERTARRVLAEVLHAPAEPLSGHRLGTRAHDALTRTPR